MKTIIRTPEERLRARMAGELRARTCFVQFLCAVSILRTLLTRVVPLAGSAAWWVAMLCLLPGITVFALLNLSMRLTRTDTLTDCLRVCLGAMGSWVLGITLTVLLLFDGVASLTALITMFTEGIGTRGTQVTLSLLTCAVLLACLHREGLPRGVYLLRWVILGAAGVIVLFGLQSLQLDGLFPLTGDGTASIRAALNAGISLAWPILLLLTLPSRQGKPHCAAIFPAVLPPAAVLLFIVLSCPHELLVRHRDLAGSLLLPTMYAAPAVRTLAQCLLMLVLFLAAGSAVQLATDHLCAPMGEPPRWLPYAVLILLAASQALDIRMLWQTFGMIEPWLLLPLAILAITCIPLALARRKRA